MQILPRPHGGAAPPTTSISVSREYLSACPALAFDCSHDHHARVVVLCYTHVTDLRSEGYDQPPLVCTALLAISLQMPFVSSSPPCLVINDKCDNDAEQ